MEAHNRYAFTTDVLAPGYAVAHQVTLSRLWSMIRIVGAIAIGAGIAMIAGSNSGVGALLIIIGVWFLLVPRFANWWSARALRSTPMYGRDVEWTVAADGVVLSSEGLDSPMPWSSFSQVVDTDEGLLLVRPGTFYWLPTDRFVETDGHRLSSELAELSGVRFSRR